MKESLNSYKSGPDEEGFFNIHGGRFVAETLMPLILDLEKEYKKAKTDKNFSKEIGYCASKSAVNMMMKYFGTKLGKKYLFNNIVLGGVEQKGLSSFFKKNYNKNNPKGQMMKLDEIYPVINILLDKNNTHTNAQEIFVDGGWLSW